MEQYFNIGVITAPHGVHGEMRVFPTTDEPKRFKKLKTVIMERDGRRDVRKVISVKFVKNMVVIGMEGIETMNDAEKYRNYNLLVERADAIPLAENEYFIADLIGLKVQTEEGEELGTLADVMTTGANDVYVVDTDRYGEVLIPAIKQCIISIDINEGLMKVHLLDGLVD